MSNKDLLLEIRDLRAWYGESLALKGFDLRVQKGELVTLLGRNGAGKTTTLRSIMGLTRRTGSIVFRGDELIHGRSDIIARKGIGYCPEERGIFSSLSVAENLTLLPKTRPGGMSVDQIYGLFPNLKERADSQGTKLSGGEQQMLAIGRILLTGADLLLLDEPSEGLAPVVVQQIAHTIRKLKDLGFTILLVEQNFRFADAIADRHYVMENGKIIDEFSKNSPPYSVEKLKSYLGL